MLQLEMFANGDEQFVGFLVGYSKVDEMRDKARELIKNKVLLVL